MTWGDANRGALPPSCAASRCQLAARLRGRSKNATRQKNRHCTPFIASTYEHVARNLTSPHHQEPDQQRRARGSPPHKKHQLRRCTLHYEGSDAKKTYPGKRLFRLAAAGSGVGRCVRSRRSAARRVDPLQPLDHLFPLHNQGQPYRRQCTCPPAARSITSARSQHQQLQQQRPAPLQSASRAAASHRSSQRAALGDPSSSSSSSPPLQPPPPSDINLSGLWAKDAARSDLGAYERSLDLLGLSGLQRATAKLIDGIEIRQVARVHTPWLHDCLPAVAAGCDVLVVMATPPSCWDCALLRWFPPQLFTKCPLPLPPPLPSLPFPPHSHPNPRPLPLHPSPPHQWPPPQDPATFTVSFVTVVPFFKVTERFPLSGSSQLGRRDLRSGRQTVAARRIEGGVAAVMSWGEPLAGVWGWVGVVWGGGRWGWGEVGVIYGSKEARPGSDYLWQRPGSLCFARRDC